MNVMCYYNNVKKNTDKRTIIRGANKPLTSDTQCVILTV